MSRYRISGLLTRTTLVIGLAAGVAAGLQGCVLALAGAAGGGALVATDRRTLGAQTEDREIQVKALSELNKNLPDASHVNVAVFNQRVLLTGEVPDPAAKQQAESIVRGIPNVKVSGIVNELAVQPASSYSSRANDAYLEARVKAELVAYKDISANNFKVVSERGIVYLMGLVTPDEGNIATNAVSQLNGVQQVVKVFEYISPQQATASAAPVSAPPPAPPADEAPTVGAIPDSSVTSRPLDSNRRRR